MSKLPKFLIRDILPLLLWAFTLTSVILCSATICPAQWAQWGGPERNFQAKPIEIATTWPTEGPKRLWSREIGEGYSAISVDQGVLYTMYRQGNEEVTIALDAASGTVQWEYRHPEPAWPDLNAQYGAGPHATPLIVGDYVYTVGGRTELLCLNKKTGKKVWSHNLWDEFGAKPPDRGYASSPMAYKQMLIIPVGGKGHGVIAFDLRNGDVIWKNQDFDNAFSSPIVINVDGQDQLVVFVKGLVAGLDPNTGVLLWKHSHHTKYDIHASTPVWVEGNLLFISSAYDAGSRVLRLSQKNGKTKVEELWYNQKMKIQHGTAVSMGGTVYGSSGDFGPAFLTSVTAATGEITAKQRGFAKANVLAVGKKLVVLAEDGELALVTPTGDDFEVNAQANVLSTRAWTVPTLIGTTLFLRDLKEIVALDLTP